ncbi:MAG: LLM class flavin-dependent oxidoreductase [Candidatus Dormibacteraceae bacterium]
MIEAQEDLTWERWRRVVADAERLGFASLRVSDHLESVMGIRGRTAVPAWPALTVAAELTERIQLGTMVSPLTFYEPGVLLREAVALDQLSGGRLILGLGAGWNQREHERFGVEFGSWTYRFDRLEHGLELLKRLNAEHPDGRELPLLLGGSGLKRSLPLAARYATEWNAQAPTPERYRELTQALDQACAAIGRDPASLRRSSMTSFLIGRNQAELAERAVELGKILPWLTGSTPDELVAAAKEHWPAVGTPDQIVARLRPFAEAGVELFCFQHFLHLDSDGLQLLAREVAPAFA